jgi:hypothetical protein
MQVDRVSHHRVIDHHDPQPLSVIQPERSASAKLTPLNEPRKAFHGPVRCSSTPGRITAIGILERRVEVLVGQHASAVVAQPDTGIVEPRQLARMLHIDEWVAGLARGVRWRGTRAVAGWRRCSIAAAMTRAGHS